MIGKKVGKNFVWGPYEHFQNKHNNFNCSFMILLKNFRFFAVDHVVNVCGLHKQEKKWTEVY